MFEKVKNFVQAKGGSFLQRRASSEALGAPCPSARLLPSEDAGVLMREQARTKKDPFGDVLDAKMAKLHEGIVKHLEMQEHAMQDGPGGGGGAVLEKDSEAGATTGEDATGVTTVTASQENTVASPTVTHVGAAVAPQIDCTTDGIDGIKLRHSDLLEGDCEPEQLATRCRKVRDATSALAKIEHELLLEKLDLRVLERKLNVTNGTSNADAGGAAPDAGGAAAGASSFAHVEEKFAAASASNAFASSAANNAAETNNTNSSAAAVLLKTHQDNVEVLEEEQQRAKSHLAQVTTIMAERIFKARKSLGEDMGKLVNGTALPNETAVVFARLPVKKTGLDAALRGSEFSDPFSPNTGLGGIAKETGMSFGDSGALATGVV